MKQFTIGIICMALSQSLSAQQAVQDSVIMGPSYANEVYYILSDGTKADHPADNWHLGFVTNAYSATIISNAASTSVSIWPGGTNADFETVDTTGYSTWPVLTNDSIDFELGAFNSNSAGGMDYGWGAYNTATHMITGDSVYLVKIGTSVYKVDIMNRASGTYTLRYADVANTTGTEVTIAASSYTTKDLVFFNLVDGQIKDNELENWDLWAVKYHDYYGEYPNQTVTGILTNPKWEVAVVDAGSGNQATHTDYASGNFSTDKNELGQSYKWLNSSFQWEVTDAKVYYLQNAEGDVWKWYPTNFVGTSEGKTVFFKQQMAFAGIESNEVQFVDVYPNPAQDRLNIVFDSNANETVLNIRNTMGQIVYTENFASTSGITQKQLDIAGYINGMYFLEITQNGSTTIKNIIKQ